jgi:hypothetical protein
MAEVNESTYSGSNTADAGQSLFKRRQSALDQTGPRLSQPGRQLLSVRGLSDPSRSTNLCYSRVVQFLANDAQAKQLEAVFHVAQLDGFNLGRDLEKLIPLFKKSPELLESLDKVSQANQLFGISAQNCSPEKFDLMKREFLFELIRSSVCSGLLNQGETSTCPTAVLRGMQSAKSKIACACDLALTGKAVMADGTKVVFSVAERFIRNAEKVSGIKLDDTNGYSRSLGSVTARMPSFFMALVNATIHEQFDDNQINVEDGYDLRSVAKLAGAVSGKKAVCWCPAPGDEKNRLVSHIYDQINQISSIDELSGGIDTDNPAGVGVAVAMHWCDVQAGKNGQVLHGKHCLRAIGFKSIDNDTYVVLSNPIGDYVDVAGSKREGITRFHAPGTTLGDNKDITWIVGDKPGEVYIKRDVFEHNLIAAVTFDENIVGQLGKDTLVIGTGADASSVDYIVPKAVDGNTSENKSDSKDPNHKTRYVVGAEKPLTAGEWLAQEALNKQLESRAKSRQVVLVTDPRYDAERRQEEEARLEEAQAILAEYDQAMNLMFNGTRVSPTPLASRPPPPPQSPPNAKTTLAV